MRSMEMVAGKRGRKRERGLESERIQKLERERDDKANNA